MVLRHTNFIPTDKEKSALYSYYSWIFYIRTRLKYLVTQ